MKKRRLEIINQKVTLVVLLFLVLVVFTVSVMMLPENVGRAISQGVEGQAQPQSAAIGKAFINFKPSGG